MAPMRMNFVKSLWVFVGLVILPGSSLAAGDQRKSVPASAARLALVVGNAKYVKLGKLDNPGRDARLMAEKLQQLGFDVTEVADRDLKSMTSDVEDFARKIKARGPETVSVLYYAGHGLENDSINYLVPVGADIKKRADVAPQSLSVKRVADRLSSAGNQLNILIIDACRDNPFPPGMAPATTLGLVPMGAVYGVFIASSTGSGKVALDGDDGHSPYTQGAGGGDHRARREAGRRVQERPPSGSPFHRRAADPLGIHLGRTGLLLRAAVSRCQRPPRNCLRRQRRPAMLRSTTC